MNRSPELPPTIVPAGHKPVGKHEDQATWDAYLQRRSGSLFELRELGHYLLTAGYVFQRDDRAVSILDAGCGDGQLFDVLRHQASRIERYLGLDLSAWGVEQARKRWPMPNVAFEAADLYTWKPAPSVRFDRIVFCESLQYIEQPMAALKRYAEYLTEGGYVVASVFEMETRRAVDFWRDADADFECLDAVSVRNDLAGLTWHVRMMRPR